jgi:hypothetical protein
VTLAITPSYIRAEELLGTIPCTIFGVAKADFPVYRLRSAVYRFRLLLFFASHEVLDQQNFVADLTVNQFVDDLACQQDSIPAGTHALLRT